MYPYEKGFQLVELVIVLALLTLSLTWAVAPVTRWIAAEHVRCAATEVAGALRQARWEAVRHSRNVGIKFREEPDGSYSYQLYQDQDGDGVRNDDLESGIDVPLGARRRLEELGSRLGFLIPEDLQPPDPANPRQRLSRLEDPIRFNNSDLAAFSSLGTATPGSVYVSNRKDQLAVVRVLGTSGRVQVLLYDEDADRWDRR